MLDLLSNGQRTQEFDVDSRGKELAGKRDDLNGTCDDEDFAQRVQAENRNLRAAAKFFDGNGMQTRHDDAGFDRKRYGERQSRNQGAQLNALSSCVEYYGQGQNTEH